MALGFEWELDAEAEALNGGLNFATGLRVGAQANVIWCPSSLKTPDKWDYRNTRKDFLGALVPVTRLPRKRVTDSIRRCFNVQPFSVSTKARQPSPIEILSRRGGSVDRNALGDKNAIGTQGPSSTNPQIDQALSRFGISSVLYTTRNVGGAGHFFTLSCGFTNLNHVFDSLNEIHHWFSGRPATGVLGADNVEINELWENELSECDGA